MKLSLFSIAIVLLTSCGTTTLRQPFRSYNHAYADTLNEQMLLNLARLHNGHPPYFLAVGTINNRYTFAGEVGGGGNWADNDSTEKGLTAGSNYAQIDPLRPGLLGIVGKTITTTAGAASSVLTGGTAQGKLGVSNSPDFQLIPLNNDIVAKQFLEPIPTEVFFTLYQQGLPMDQLLRVLVERIETTLPNGEDLVLNNAPTSGTEESYARFLRACAILREMQHSGHLLMDTKRESKVIGVTSSEWKITGKDLIDANDKKLIYRKNSEGGLDLVEEVFTQTFYLKTESASRVKKHLYETDLIDDHDAIDNIVDLLGRGIVVKNKSEGSQGIYSRLILRSYSRAIAAAASEQDGFDALMKRDSFKRIVPLCEQHPILRTVWPGKQPPLCKPLQSLRYANQTYQVTDPVLDPLDANVRWNRDVFRLLVELGSLVSVDISKFQRQVLEVR